MILPLAIPAAFFAGGLGRRVAGGLVQDLTGVNTGDTPVRLFFGATVGASALMGGAPWWAAAALIPLTWIGTVTSNFGSLAMGHGGNTLARDVGGMTLHGMLSAAAPALAAWWMGYGWLSFLIAGILIAPCYIAGYQIDGVRGDAKLPPGVQAGSAMGEFLWGGLCGLAALASALLR